MTEKGFLALIKGEPTSKYVYHRHTFELLDQKPKPSVESENLLHSIERVFDITLPAAFREWYTFDNAAQILASYSNRDRPIPLQQLGLPLERWLPYQPATDGVLPFMVENQGVCTWAIRLNDGDDPAVLVEVDSGTPPRWQLCAERFSNWVYWLVHDWHTLEQMRFQAQAAPLTDADITLLQADYHEIGRTYAWPGTINYRCFGAAGELLIWAGPSQADWFLAPNPGMEQALLTHLWACADLATSLYGMREEDQQLLEQFSSKFLS